MKKSDINYLVGCSNVENKPIEPFSEIVCEFLGVLSTILRNDVEAKRYPDIITFSFWIRNSNIKKLKRGYMDNRRRIGRGVTFHVVPSNVPINFAFSYVFGLLSGNSNIVRLPSKKAPQMEIICRILNKLLQMKKYDIIKTMTSIISYEIDNEITSQYSKLCDSRIIWGGDETIKNIRSLPIKERTVELVFADRYSFSIIDSKSIIDMDDKELSILAEKFYNDTYLMDQNACSSPYLVLWYNGDNSDKYNEKGKKRFWRTVYEVSKKYDLTQIKVINKYTQLCKNIIEFEDIINIKMYENILYVVDVSKIKNSEDRLRGRFGLFYEFDIEDLDSVIPVITKKIQTLTYFGIDKERLVNFVIKNNLIGVDRIVPIGSALDMGVIWDGYDIIGALSRIIEVK